jgi:hypothetical protein
MGTAMLQALGSNPEMQGQFPNLYIVGSAKAGTSALHAILSRHPSVFAPTGFKEPNFMAYEGNMPSLNGPEDHLHGAGQSIIDRDRYLELYHPAGNKPWRLDASPIYLIHPDAPGRIKKYAPDSKIIIILRNPTDCAFSMYCMMRRMRREPITNFMKAFRESSRRMEAGWEYAWDYADRYHFAPMIRRYMSAFDKDQMLLLNYDDWKRDNVATLTMIAGFLGIDPKEYPPAKIRVNTAPTRRSLFWSGAFTSKIRPVVSKITPLIPSRLRKSFSQGYYDQPIRLGKKDRAILNDYYRDDLREVEQLLGWDLRKWMN